MHVPTNAELEANGPDNAWQAVRNWLSRHVPEQPWNPYRSDYKGWLDWAATNLINDPEVKRFIKND